MKGFKFIFGRQMQANSFFEIASSLQTTLYYFAKIIPVILAIALNYIKLYRMNSYKYLEFPLGLLLLIHASYFLSSLFPCKKSQFYEIKKKKQNLKIFLVIFSLIMLMTFVEESLFLSIVTYDILLVVMLLIIMCFDSLRLIKLKYLPKIMIEFILKKKKKSSLPNDYNDTSHKFNSQNFEIEKLCFANFRHHIQNYNKLMKKYVYKKNLFFLIRNILKKKKKIFKISRLKRM